MTNPFVSRSLLATVLFVPLVGVWCSSSEAAPKTRPATRLAAAPQFPRIAAAPPSTKYAPLANLKSWQKKRAQAGDIPGGVLQPMVGGQPLKVPMRDLLSGPAPDFGAKVPTKRGLKKVDPKRFAQAFPRPVAPASPNRYPRVRPNVVPKWVRYPLEFQLGGIGIGTRAVDKDRFNRIDRYGLSLCTAIRRLWCEVFLKPPLLPVMALALAELRARLARRHRPQRALRERKPLPLRRKART